MKSRSPRQRARVSAARQLGSAETAAYAVFFFLVAVTFSTELQVQFTLPKLVVVRASAVVLAAFWAVRAARNQIQPLPRLVLAATVALAAWWIVTTLFAVHQPTALNGAHGRYNGLWTQLLFLALFSMVASSRWLTSDVERLLKWLVAALVPGALYALVQYAGLDPITWPGQRSASTIGNPVILAATLGIATPVALAFALLARRSAERALWAGMVVLYLAAAFTTLSRGPLIATIGALSIVFAGAAWEHRQRLSRTAIVAAVLVAVAVATGGAVAVVQVRGGLAAARSAEASATVLDRLNMYSAALHIVRDYPVVGVGLESFNVVYPRYRPIASERLTPDVLPTMVHNGYLQAAATTGIPGLIAYVVLVAAVMWSFAKAYLRAADRHARAMLVAFVASVSGYLVQDLSGWGEISLSTFFWMVLGLGVAFTRALDGAPPIRRSARPIVYIAAAVVSMFALWLTVEAATLLPVDRAVRRVASLSVSQAWPRIERDLMVASRSGEAAYLDRAALRYAERFASASDPAAYTKSAELFDEAQRRDPLNPYYVVHRIALYATAAQKNVAHDAAHAEKLVAHAIAMDRNNASVHEVVARLRLAQRRFPDALDSIRHAKTLRPAQGKFLTLEGDVQRAAKDINASLISYEHAASLLGEGSTDWVSNHQKLIVTMIEMGHYQRAVDAARRLTAVRPAEAMGYTLLGFAHLQLHSFAPAREAFQRALVINPNDVNAKQGLTEVIARLGK